MFNTRACQLELLNGAEPSVMSLIIPVIYHAMTNQNVCSERGLLHILKIRDVDGTSGKNSRDALLLRPHQTCYCQKLNLCDRGVSITRL